MAWAHLVGYRGPRLVSCQNCSVLGKNGGSGIVKEFPVRFTTRQKPRPNHVAISKGYVPTMKFLRQGVTEGQRSVLGHFLLSIYLSE